MALNPLPTQTSLAKGKPRRLGWLRWWRGQNSVAKDQFAMLGPLVSVFLFVLVMISAFGYMRLEETEREKEALTRDVEYSQQRLRLRLLERQEQLMRIAGQISNKEFAEADFNFQAENLVRQYPELLSITWLDERSVVKAIYATSGSIKGSLRKIDEVLSSSETNGSYDLARELLQPIYSTPIKNTGYGATLLVQIPLTEASRFSGMVMGEFSIEGLLRFGVPAEVLAKYAVAMWDNSQSLLAGNLPPVRTRLIDKMRWGEEGFTQEVPVSPVGNSLVLRAQTNRTFQDGAGDGFMWLIVALSTITLWMLGGTWRHTRRRIEAQQALVAETNFRRAMENSMLTGMRALDLQGRITYVNPAFCSMTGWTEFELVGRTAPFPYWPEEDHEGLTARLEDELRGRTNPGGFEERLRRRNGQIFDARMYVSPLIDPHGVQTGWMTSMTDITEPRRIRQELTASYERFTTVLESLDSAVSVVPLGGDELLFANKLYRLWFAMDGLGHRKLVNVAGVPALHGTEDADQVDDLAGLPTDPLTDASPEHADVFMEDLNKWVEVRSRYVTWVDGRLAQMVIATDITARRRAEQLTAEQAERAQTASRLITMGEMASSVAHELNQPLTAISNYCSGMVSRLQKKQISEEDLLVALEKTARQAQRAGQIVQRIKAFVKRSEPNPTPSEVENIVANAVELADIELRRQQVRLTQYVAARLPLLVVDPILIEQVLINLLKNGAESILQAQRPVAQRQLELKVVPRRVHGLEVVEFSVRDNGSGVPTELLDRIYEAFYSTKSEGMGIGLKLCRSIIESHSGRIQVENLYNGKEVLGCIFSFWIPVIASPRTKMGPPNSA